MVRVPQRDRGDGETQADDERNHLDETLTPGFLLRRAPHDARRVFFRAIEVAVGSCRFVRVVRKAACVATAFAGGEELIVRFFTGGMLVRRRMRLS